MVSSLNGLVLDVKSYLLRCITLICSIAHYLGKVTVYLGKRDFIDHLDYTDPIDGVLVVENDYLQGRKIFGQVNKASLERNIISRCWFNVLCLYRVRFSFARVSKRS